MGNAILKSIHYYNSNNSKANVNDVTLVVYILATFFSELLERNGGGGGIIQKGSDKLMQLQ